MTTETIEAGHRVIIKRAMRREKISPATVPDLDAWAKANPDAVARVLCQWFDNAARAWTEGNNSGDSATYTRQRAQQERLHRQAESVLALWGVKVDYPGLYPCFVDAQGRHEHTPEPDILARFLRETA